MKYLLIISCLALGQNLWAQRADSTRVFNEEERNELGAILHFGISGGILTNLNNQALANVRPEISFGGSLRLLLSPSYYWTPGEYADNLKTPYLLAGLAGQHIINGFLIQGKLMTNINRGRSNFQIAAGMGIPLSEKAWFRLEYTAQMEQRSQFSGNMLSAGLHFSLHELQQPVISVRKDFPVPVRGHLHHQATCTDAV